MEKNQTNSIKHLPMAVIMYFATARETRLKFCTEIRMVLLFGISAWRKTFFSVEWYSDGYHRV